MFGWSNGCKPQVKQKGFTYFWTSFTVVESNNEGLSCFVCVSIILKGVLYKLGLNACLIRLFKSFLQKQWLWRIHKLSSSTVVTKEGNSVLMFFSFCTSAAVLERTSSGSAGRSLSRGLLEYSLRCLSSTRVRYHVPGNRSSTEPRGT